MTPAEFQERLAAERTAEAFAAELEREFGSRLLTLPQISQRFLGCGHEHAQALASRNRLPIPVFRGVLPRSPLLVRAEDLGALLARQYEEARRQWEALRSSSPDLD